MGMIHTLLLQLGNTERSPASEATFLRVIFPFLQENNPGCANIRCSLFTANEKAGARNDHSTITRCSQRQQSTMTRNSLINKKQVTVIARIWEKRKPDSLLWEGKFTQPVYKYTERSAGWTEMPQHWRELATHAGDWDSVPRNHTSYYNHVTPAPR